MSMEDRFCSIGNYSTINMIGILSKQKQVLKVCHPNAQSLPAKIDELRYIFESSDVLVDVVCVSETWFSSWHSDNLICVSGLLFRQIE